MISDRGAPYVSPASSNSGGKSASSSFWWSLLSLLSSILIVKGVMGGIVANGPRWRVQKRANHLISRGSNSIHMGFSPTRGPRQDFRAFKPLDLAQIPRCRHPRPPQSECGRTAKPASVPLMGDFRASAPASGHARNGKNIAKTEGCENLAYRFSISYIWFSFWAFLAERR